MKCSSEETSPVESMINYDDNPDYNIPDESILNPTWKGRSHEG